MAPRYSFQDIRTKDDSATRSDSPRKVPVRSIPASSRKSPDHEDERSSSGSLGDPLFRRRAKLTETPVFSPISQRVTERMETIQVEQPSMGMGPRLILWAFALGTVSFLALSLMAFFASATISVVPKSAALPASLDISAGIASGKLQYNTVSFSKEETKHISAPVRQEVARKASGKIIIYNEFSKDSQRLIKNTRFEAVNKKIYRLQESVVIPGFKTVDGKISPGVLEATVYAEEPGEAYNQDVTTFTLPALATSARFSKVYAKSKTTMAGGFIGEIRTASSNDLALAREELKKSVESSLVAELKATQPDGTIFYPGTLFFVYDDLIVPTNSTTPSVPVTQKVTVYAPLFSRGALTALIGGAAIPAYDGAPIVIKNIDEISVTVVGKDGIKIPGDKLVLRVAGQADIVWTPPAKEISQALAGTRKSNFQTTIAQFTHLETASATVRPPWQRSFPADSEDIKVVIKE